MFTGLIEEQGRVIRVDITDPGCRRLRIQTSKLPHLALGASVAVNGVCQTVIASGPDWFAVDTLEQSLGKTNLGLLSTGDAVNLERAMAGDSRFDGHIVQGHGECRVAITRWHQQGTNWYLGVRIPQEKLHLCIPEGSICLDGISLTISSIRGDEVVCNVIPHTREHTTLAHRRVGDQMNLETDLVGRYIARLAEVRGGLR